MVSIRRRDDRADDALAPERVCGRPQASPRRARATLISDSGLEDLRSVMRCRSTNRGALVEPRGRKRRQMLGF